MSSRFWDEWPAEMETALHLRGRFLFLKQIRHSQKKCIFATAKW